MSYLIQTAETNAFLQLVKFVADLLDEGQVQLIAVFLQEHRHEGRAHVMTSAGPFRTRRNSRIQVCRGWRDLHRQAATQSAAQPATVPIQGCLL